MTDLAIRPDEAQGLLDLEALTAPEQDELHRCEAVIEEGRLAFLEVGNALATVREKRLYRATHRTFEDYVQQRWDMGRAHAYRLLDAAQVVGALSPIGDTGVLPQNEAQVRPLVQLPPEERQEAWQEAVETAPEGKVTGAHVQEIVNKRRLAPEEWDYGPFGRNEPVTWLEDGSGDLRRGRVKDLRNGQVVIEPTDGRGPETVLLAPNRPGLRIEQDPEERAAPSLQLPGMLEDLGEPASPIIPGDKITWQVGDGDHAVTHLGIAMRLENGHWQVSTLEPTRDTTYVRADEPTLRKASSTPAAVPAPPAAPPVAVSSPAPAAAEPSKPAALKSAEEIVAERHGTAVPTSIGAVPLDAPIAMCMVTQDCVDWLRSGGFTAKDFLYQLKSLAYTRGLGAAELLTLLNTEGR